MNLTDKFIENNVTNVEDIKKIKDLLRDE